MALIDNLVSYWKLDEASGNAADSVGSNTLTNTGTVAFAAGKINNGVTLVRGNSKSLAIADASQTGLDLLSTDFTLQAWVKPSSAPTGVKYQIINKYQGGVSEAYELSYRDDSGMKVNWQMVNGGTSDYIVWATDLGTGTFKHLVLVFDSANTEVTLYVDGSAVSTQQTNCSTPQNTTVPFAIGADSSISTIGFNGMIDEVGVWTRKLTSTEVTSLYNSGNGLQYPFSSGPANLKSYNTNLKANIKSINTNPIANTKSLNTNI